MSRFHATAIVCASVLSVGATACSNSTGGDDRAATSTTDRESSGAVQRPEGPSAAVEPIDAPGEPFIGEATPNIPEGYEQAEYLVSGDAVDYRADGSLSNTGQWTLKAGSSAPFATRVLVRRPTDTKDFSGTVVVEWLNVSGGVDANPDFTALADEIARQGHIWVGVSAQLIGVEGGPVLVKAPGTDQFGGKGLVNIDPERYGDLNHPGDGYSFDMFTQVARAVRAGGPLTADMAPEVVIAVGESQSAIALTSYYNGVQPLTAQFDGFFIHSRAFSALPFVEPGKAADLAGSMGTTKNGVLLRTDVDAPVMQLQAEGDVLGILNSYDARQPDSDRFRLWEVAGTAHADAYLLGPIAELLDCGGPINQAPFHLVAKAAFRALEEWVRSGDQPPYADRLEVTGMTDPKFVRDGLGVVEGGVRLPVTDVPSELLSGDPAPKPDIICQLLGSTTPIPAAKLKDRYKDRADYETQYEAATDAAIKAGFILEDDRDALGAYAQPDRIG